MTDGDYSLDALFPELTEAQRLGFYTDSRLDLGATHAEAVAMLDRLECGEPYTDSDGYAWLIHASTRDAEHQRLAWVEWRMRERGLHEDHDFYLKARDAAGKLRVWQIETVNPCFGCSVQSLTWDGDDVVLVYADKHTTWEARLGPDGPVRRQEAARDEVACQLTPADVQAVHEALYRPARGARHWGRHEGWRRVLAGVALGGFIVLLLKLFARNKIGADLVGWDMVAGAMLGGAALGAWWARKNTTVPPADSPVYRPFTLSLETTGFRVRGEGFDNYTGWDQVTALREAVVNPPARMPLDRLRYRLTRDDVSAFFALKREQTGWRGALFYLLLFPAMFLPGLLIEGLDDSAWLIAFAAGLFGIWLITRIVLIIDRRIAIARHPLDKGEIELQRWGDHLRVLADGRDTRTSYAQIGDVVAMSDHVFLMTARECAIIVPRRAFASTDAMAAFVAEVNGGAQESTP